MRRAPKSPDRFTWQWSTVLCLAVFAEACQNIDTALLMVCDILDALSAFVVVRPPRLRRIDTMFHRDHMSHDAPEVMASRYAAYLVANGPFADPAGEWPRLRAHQNQPAPFQPNVSNARSA